MDIKVIKSEEMQEIIDFYYFIEEYGHIFYGDDSELTEPFKKIMDGISDVRNIIEDYYSY